jgi:hypothetical protein
MDKYVVADVALQMPSKEVAVAVFRDVLGLEPMSSVSKEPMHYMFNEHTALYLDLPEDNPTYGTRLTLYTSQTQFNEILPKLQTVKGIQLVLKENQTAAGKDRKSVLIEFEGCKTKVLIVDTLGR